MLSHLAIIGDARKTPRSRKRYCNYVASAVATARAQCSAFVLDRATVGYFLAAQEIKLPPSKIQNPVVDRLVKVHPSQYESE